MMLRRAAVAGSFYPASATQLRQQIVGLLDPDCERRRAIAVVVPHAGYRYSGAVAGSTWSRIVLPEHFIILAPNHTGLGEELSVWSEGEWELPLGRVAVDTSLATALMKRCPLLKKDREAHLQEHSLEVQLPFLQILIGQFSFVPITLMRLEAVTCRQIGLAIAQTILESHQDVLIVASSDMNHYENQQTTLAKDQLAIDTILALDADGLHQTVRTNRITMCGVIPTTIALHAAIALGAQQASLVRHATSGDVTGDYGSVVGYAGLVIS